jgi:hypothetical protein
MKYWLKKSKNSIFSAPKAAVTKRPDLVLKLFLVGC